MVIRRIRQEQGYTLTELMLVVAIGLILVGMAMGGVPAFIKVSKADGGLALAASGLRQARELSISNRRNVRLTFGTNTIMITKVEYCAGVGCTPATTLMYTIRLEGRNEFRLSTGLPDTPDAFGMASATAFGTAVPPMFTTDGSFINSNGDVLNGTLFIGVPGETISARAITVFGPTGAMRLWRWDGRQWVEV
jgi:prepilin-type N-terminal cleavage/methylation domain-containing protein